MFRKIILLTLIILAMSLIVNRISGSGQEESAPFCKIKNAVITYEYYGLDKGTIKLMVKDNGSFVRREENRIMTSDDEKREYKSFYLLTPQYYYDVNVESNIAIRMKRPANMDELITIHEILYGEQAESLETDDRYQKKKNESVAGQACKVYHDKISATTYWIWENIKLKEESLDWETKKPSGIRAVSVDLDPKFVKDIFELPEDIEIIGGCLPDLIHQK